MNEPIIIPLNRSYKKPKYRKVRCDQCVVVVVNGIVVHEKGCPNIDKKGKSR
jgi:hypothetical protein